MVKQTILVFFIQNNKQAPNKGALNYNQSFKNNIIMYKELEESYNQVTEGYKDPEALWVELLQAEKDFKMVKDLIREAVANRIKQNKTSGAFSLSYKKNYDFSGVNFLNEKKGKAAEIAAEIKTIENQLKLASEATPYVDLTSGEVITAQPFTTTEIITYREKK